MKWLAKILVGPIVEQVAGVAKTWIGKEVSEDEKIAQITEAVTKGFDTLPREAANVLVAEAKGESWLQRNWRPLTGASLGFTVFFWAVLVPISVDWIGLPPIRIGDLLLEWVFTGLLTFGTVYGGGRTIEKITKTVVAGIRK